jgi:hypothetical protein
MMTSPMMAAFSATKTPLPSCGVTPRNVRIVDI